MMPGRTVWDQSLPLVERLPPAKLPGPPMPGFPHFPMGWPNKEVTSTLVPGTNASGGLDIRIPKPAGMRRVRSKRVTVSSTSS